MPDCLSVILAMTLLLLPWISIYSKRITQLGPRGRKRQRRMHNKEEENTNIKNNNYVQNIIVVLDAE